jgi:hypothetical protein
MYSPNPCIFERTCYPAVERTAARLQQWVGAVFGDNAIGLRFLGLVLGFELVGDAVVLLGEPLFGLERGDTAGSCRFVSICKRTASPPGAYNRKLKGDLASM